MKVTFVGTYLPRKCGIATFTHDLRNAVAANCDGLDCQVTAMEDSVETHAYPPVVVFRIGEQIIGDYERAADFLNQSGTDVVCLQHEFGIFGGKEGGHIVALLRKLKMPVVTTLHTVLSDPSSEQRRIMELLIMLSERIIIMTERGRNILLETYGVPSEMIDLIPHGIHDVPFEEPDRYKELLAVEGRQVLLTFGLLSPNKGIEHVINALPGIILKNPNVVYLVLGATHPNLVREHGEAYRISLELLARNNGVEQHVIFYNRFVDLPELINFIGAADIYITPYLNEQQIVSGTLAYAFGAGKAVISTPYWHAEELLADGRGVLVPFRDPEAISDAVGSLLDDPAKLNTMRTEAYALGRKMTWAAVAGQYSQSFEHALADRREKPRTAFAKWTLEHRLHVQPPRRLDHLFRMSDGTGIFQHATFNVPNFHEGYCVDDNARAFILCILLDELGELPPTTESIGKLANVYLAFLAASFDNDSGHFRNFMSHGRMWLEHTGSEDSHGRSLWATGTGAVRSRDEGHRKLSTQLFENGLPIVESFTSPRSWAFALLGIHEFQQQFPERSQVNEIGLILTRKLVDLWNDCATDAWPWFEASVTYENARLCQALITSGKCIGDDEALQVGLKSLLWLASIQTTQSGWFQPIGSNGFYKRGGVRADFDQQPVEAQAMVSACNEAFRATKDARWTIEAQRAFEWFLGRNDLNLPLYDFTTGGCRDGLHNDRVNENQGAESTLAFHLSLAEMNCAQQLIAKPLPEYTNLPNP